MREKVLLVVPEAPAPQTIAVPGSRKITGGGLRLGILDNSKGNADHLLRFVIDGVKAALPVASVASLRKPHPTGAATSEVIDQLAAEADFVVSAMAD
ncbi:MAG: hypothetical protein OEZ08_07175 [Betaproteobacteria bacterium]|nr:hypothetical protein [Betaproteobacteria bacterium]